MERSPKVESFSKALRLIDGCESYLHLEGAKRYVDLFEKMYAVDRNSRQMVDILHMKIKDRRKLM